MSNDKMRAEFEAWAVAEGLTLHGKDGRYLMEIQSAWMAWQASRAAMVIELPQGSEPGDFTHPAMVIEIDEVVSAIEDVGVRVKS